MHEMHEYNFPRYRYVTIAVLSSVFFVSNGRAQQGPMIERIEPTAGPVGSSVDIIGRRFNGKVEVKLGKTALEVQQNTAYRITAKITSGATSGPIIVTTDNGSVDGPDFQIIAPLPVPEISGFAPVSGPPGSEVSISGQNFSARLTQNQVLLGKTPVVVRIASPVELRIIVPEGAETGLFSVEVINGGKAESKKPFDVTTATAISDFEPRAGGPGAKITITGQGFKTNVLDNRVYLNNLPLRVLSASEDRLIAEIPKNASSGPLLVDVRYAGRAYSKEMFTVQYVPTIVGFTPFEGSSGTSLTIRGTNFGTDPNNIEVQFGKATAKIIRVEKTGLVVEVPKDAESGKLSVTANQVGPAVSERIFTVLAPLNIDEFSPRSGPAGTVVSIDGAGFSDVINNNIVTLGGRQLNVISATPTKLKVRISPGPSAAFIVTVQGNRTARTADPFLITLPPQIASFEPKQGTIGSDVTIRGRGFSANSAVFKVSLGGQDMEVLSVKDDIAVVRVTSGSQTGPIRVSVPIQGSSVSEDEFQVVNPQISEKK
jgi:hypothetical protein